jgi:hypothetical protein
MKAIYKTLTGLKRYCLDKISWKNIRVELFTDTGIYGDPYKTFYIKKEV